LKVGFGAVWASVQWTDECGKVLSASLFKISSNLFDLVVS